MVILKMTDNNNNTSKCPWCLGTGSSKITAGPCPACLGTGTHPKHGTGKKEPRTERELREAAWAIEKERKGW